MGDESPQNGDRSAEADEEGSLGVRKPADTSERLSSEIKRRKQAERTLKERLTFEELLSSISASFINISTGRVDEEIHSAMKKVLKFFEVDRFALLQAIPDKKSWIITHSASVAGVPSVPVGAELSVSMNPWAYEKLVIDKNFLFYGWSIRQGNRVCQREICGKM